MYIYYKSNIYLSNCIFFFQITCGAHCNKYFFFISLCRLRFTLSVKKAQSSRVEFVYELHTYYMNVYESLAATNIQWKAKKSIIYTHCARKEKKERKEGKKTQRCDAQGAHFYSFFLSKTKVWFLLRCIFICKYICTYMHINLRIQHADI